MRELTKLCTYLFALAAVAVAPTMARAQSALDGQLVELFDGDNAGTYVESERLGNTIQRNNNNQIGSGAEHTRCALATDGAGKRLVCFMTASYTVNGVPVNNTVQNLCVSTAISATGGITDVVSRYVTNNTTGNNNRRNGHDPDATTVLGGAAVLTTYNYRPDDNGNTNLYGLVVGPRCEELAAQTLLFEEDNDNVLGSAQVVTNAGILADSATETRIARSGIGNGNGEDAGWVLGLRVKKNGNTITIDRYKAGISVEEEERSRSSVAPMIAPDRVLVCSAVGNTQPPNRGVDCAIMDMSTNQNLGERQSRIANRRIMQAGNGYRYSTPGVVAVRNPDGTLTGDYIVQVVEVDYANRVGKYKAPTRLGLAVVRADGAAGTIDVVAPPNFSLAGLGDAGHPQLCGGNMGEDGAFRAVVMLPSIIGNVGGGALRTFKFDYATKALTLETSNQFATDGGWMSQIYGENPATPQGRNHASCIPNVPNPGYGLANGYMPNAKTLLIIPTSYRKYRNNDSAQGMSAKLAFGLGVFPSETVAPGEEPEPVDPTDPTEPTDPTNPNPTPVTPGNSVGGGCNTQSGAGGWLALAAAGFALARSRRRAAAL